MDQHKLFGAISYVLVALSGTNRVAVGCFYVEIEGQPWLLDNVDRGMLKIDQMRRLTKHKQTKKVCSSYFPRSDDTKILTKKFGKFFAQDRLAISNGLSSIFNIGRGRLLEHPFWVRVRVQEKDIHRGWDTEPSLITAVVGF